MQAARGTPLNPSDSGPDATVVAATAPLGRVRGRAIFLIVALIAYGLDVLTKTLAVSRLSPGETVELIGDILTLHLVRNPGAAFSTGTRFTVGLTLVAITATCVVLYFGWRVRSRLWAVALGLLLAGVVGNLTDRMLRAPGPFRGHVVDFFQLPNWPVFNVADICINAAAGLILLQAFRGIRIDGTREGSAADADSGSAGVVPETGMPKTVEPKTVEPKTVEPKTVEPQ